MPTFLSGRTAELARYCMVGFACYATNIIGLAILCELLHMPYVAAFVVVFFISNALGYWLNKRFTFAVNAGLEHTAMVRYVLVNAIMLAIGIATLRVLVEWLHVWYLAAATIVAGINAPVSFMVHRIVTYRVATH